MNMRRAALVFESELATYEKRRAFLLDALRENPLFVATRTREGQAGTLLDVIIDGEVAVQLEGLRVTWPESCTDHSFWLSRDGVALTEPTDRDTAELTRPLELPRGLRIRGAQR